MRLAKAKAYAIEMVKGIRPRRMVADPLGRLLRLHLDVLEPMPEMAEIWAIETADYPPLYSTPLEELEAPNSADYRLEYYPDGYPILPDCLNPRGLMSSPSAAPEAPESQAPESEKRGPGRLLPQTCIALQGGALLQHRVSERTNEKPSRGRGDDQK